MAEETIESLTQKIEGLQKEKATLLADAATNAKEIEGLNKSLGDQSKKAENLAGLLAKSKDDNEKTLDLLEEANEKASKLEKQLADAAKGNNKKNAAVNPGAASEKEIPADLKDYKGSYKELATGAVFGLKTIPAHDARHKRTHHLKNADHSWEGNEEEFRAQFEKV